MLLELGGGGGNAAVDVVGAKDLMGEGIAGIEGIAGTEGTDRARLEVGLSVPRGGGGIRDPPLLSDLHTTHQQQGQRRVGRHNTTLKVLRRSGSKHRAAGFRMTFGVVSPARGSTCSSTLYSKNILIDKAPRLFVGKRDAYRGRWRK